VAIITLTTDFGLDDVYVGMMKGAILREHPAASIVDLTHAVEPGNVRHGAWLLGAAWRSFPPETFHVAVIDPGVGTNRRALAVRTEDHTFLAPDNGLLHSLFESPAAPAIRVIEEAHRRSPGLGTTFDGHDVFAPLAGRLAEGMAFEDVGPLVRDPVTLAPFHPVPSAGGWRAEIVHIDRFGNLVTTASRSFLRGSFGESWDRIAVRLGGHLVSGLHRGYSEAPEGDLVMTIGSAGTLEISRNRGSARDLIGLCVGDWVEIAPAR
jgi:S-adenosylmethionine hydrolase